MKRMLIAALTCAGLTACGGAMAPKEYVVSVTNASTVAGANADCDQAGNANYIVVEKNSTMHVVVYQGDATHYYAEVPGLSAGGGSTLEGTLANGTYSFQGQTLDETFAPDLSNKLIDDKVLTTISLTVKDSGSNNVTGTFTYEKKHTCDNLGGGNQNYCKDSGLPDQNGNTVDCITSGSLSGIALPSPEYKQGAATPGNGGLPQNF